MSQLTERLSFIQPFFVMVVTIYSVCYIIISLKKNRLACYMEKSKSISIVRSIDTRLDCIR